MSGQGEVRNLEDLLDHLEENTSGEEATLDDVRDAVGHRAYGPLLLAIGLINVSPIGMIPGIWLFTATIALIVAFQLLISADEPWMPDGVLKKSFPRKRMKQTNKWLKPWAKRVDSVIRPRFTFLFNPPVLQLVALLAIAMALITYPLSMIPGAGIISGTALVLIGLGLTVRDGLLVMFSTAFAGGAVWLLVWSMPKIVSGFRSFFEAAINLLGGS